MYLIGYMIGTVIAKRRVRRGLVPFNEAAVDSLVIYLLAGMLVGARLVYVLVYDFAEFENSWLINSLEKAGAGRIFWSLAPRPVRLDIRYFRIGAQLTSQSCRS